MWKTFTIPDSIADRPVSTLAVSVRLRFVLQKRGIKTLGDLRGRSMGEFDALVNCGPVTLAELRGLVAVFGESAMADTAPVDDAMKRKFRRVDRLFAGAGRQSLRCAARALVRAHPAMIDYVQQAPVVVVLALQRPQVGNGWVLPPGLVRHCEDGPKLRVFLDRVWRQLLVAEEPPAGLYVLRKFSGRGLREGYAAVLEGLARNIAPSTLAQLIPATPHQQEGYLRVMAGWYRQAIYREHFPDTARWEIAARMARPGAAYMGEHLADYMIARKPDRQWSAHRLLSDMLDWEDGRQYGSDDGMEIDYDPLPNVVTEFNGFQFVPLRTRRALVLEGRAMRHCVANYWQEVCDGHCSIYSIRNSAGERVATFELLPWFKGAQIGQFRAFANKNPPPAARAAAKAFSESYRSKTPKSLAPEKQYLVRQDLLAMLIPGRPLSVGGLGLNCEEAMLMQVIHQLCQEGRCAYHDGIVEAPPR